MFGAKTTMTQKLSLSSPQKKAHFHPTFSPIFTPIKAKFFPFPTQCLDPTSHAALCYKVAKF